MRNVTEIQQRLIDLGFLSPGGADGVFGTVTLMALNRFLATKGRAPVLRPPSMADLNALLFPEDQPPAPDPSIFSRLSSVLALFNLLKGKTVTSDQITGIIRLLLGIASGYLVSRGIVTAGMFEWISAGILAAIPAVWTWLNNRPKTITKIGS